MLATYFKDDRGKNEALESLKAWMADPELASNQYIQIVAGGTLVMDFV